MVLTCVTLVAAGQAPPRLTFIHQTVVAAVPGLESTNREIPENRWKEILSVYTHDAFARKINQPIAGKYVWQNDSILFTPAFPFTAGGTYHAVFSGEALLKISTSRNDLPPGEVVTLTFQVPAKQFPRTSIESLYPSSPVLPENLLRMYIHFSGPMMPGDAYQHIRLYNQEGKVVERAFLVIDQELWNEDRTRLTLLFDPGRIKRGLKTNLDLGPPLREGRTYNLVIDSAWQDIHGNSLQQSIRKTFTVTVAQRTKLSTKRLHILPPAEGSRNAVVISFDRTMDHTLIFKHVSVLNASSEKVRGTYELTDDRHLTFIPDASWQTGNYTVTISPLLEDVCGNNFNNPFDLDLAEGSRSNSTEPIKLSFSIKSLAQ